MSDFRFLPRHSISNIDFVVIDENDDIVSPDAPPTVAFKTFASETVVWQRPTAALGPVGHYRVTVSSAESANPGLFYLLWEYSIYGIYQQYRTDIEIPSAITTIYDTLSEGYQAIVDGAWMRFTDLFDSAIGGPHLQMYAQSSFGRERVAQLMRVGLNNLNTAAQPHSTYSLDTESNFPFAEWGGVLEQATTVEVIKHLMRSYVEQPEAQGVAPARLDRRDYLARWAQILDVEQETLKDQLAIFKMAQMNLGRGSILVSGGVYGSNWANSNPARRPRFMPLTFR